MLPYCYVVHKKCEVQGIFLKREAHLFEHLVVLISMTKSLLIKNIQPTWVFSPIFPQTFSPIKGEQNIQTTRLFRTSLLFGPLEQMKADLVWNVMSIKCAFIDMKGPLHMHMSSLFDRFQLYVHLEMAGFYNLHVLCMLEAPNFIDIFS